VRQERPFPGGIAVNDLEEALAGEILTKIEVFHVKSRPEVIIDALFPPEHLRYYIKNWHVYDSTHAFARAVYTDAYMEKWSHELNDFEREYLALKLEALIMYGAFKFGIEFVLAYFQEYLDAHQEDTEASRLENTP